MDIVDLLEDALRQAKSLDEMEEDLRAGVWSANNAIKGYRRQIKDLKVRIEKLESLLRTRAESNTEEKIRKLELIQNMNTKHIKFLRGEIRDKDEIILSRDVEIAWIKGEKNDGA